MNQLHLVSYPRSGNSLLAQLLTCYSPRWLVDGVWMEVVGGDNLFGKEREIEARGFPVAVDKWDSAQTGDGRFWVFKQHQVDGAFGGKRIYLHRNGFDAVVSYVHSRCHDNSSIALWSELVPLATEWNEHALKGSQYPVKVSFDELVLGQEVSLFYILKSIGVEVVQERSALDFNRLNQAYPHTRAKGYHRNGFLELPDDQARKTVREIIAPGMATLGYNL